MTSLAKSTIRTVRKETRERAPSDKKWGNDSEVSLSVEHLGSPDLKDKDIQELAIRPESLQKLRAPQPPKESPKPRATTRVLVRKTRPLDDIRTGVKVAVARPLPQDAVPLEDYTGPGGPRFDSQGMVLPHSILGSLEEFRRELEVRGEMELVKRIPDPKKQCPLKGGEEKTVEMTKIHPKNGEGQQSHALQHWNYHMAQRRRQQNFISELLQKPVKDLLMNQTNRFREIQEQRELISRGLPALELRYGRHVGSEFWNVPQQYGDELSGITATLTQTERGNPQPITHISHPPSTHLESGYTPCEGTVNRTWSHSQYLQHRQYQLRSILRDLDFIQPQIDGLEVVGCGQSSSPSFQCSPPQQGGEQEAEKEDGEGRTDGEHTVNEDLLALYNDVMMEVELIPALRFGGELARWAGSTTSHQGEVGISVRLAFEGVVGQQVASHLELKNEGSTVIYYSWHRLAVPPSFPEVQTPKYTQYFYFNTTSAVILPGDTEQIEFIFKSVSPGIMTEVWELHTHPVLLGGASLQVMLRGVALYQDKTAHLRTALQEVLEKREAVSVCRSVVCDLLLGVCTPQRPSSPDEQYKTEEEHFQTNNPNLHYHHEAVEALRRLWEQSNGSQSTSLRETESHTPISAWDLSTAHLHQMISSLPQADTERSGVCKEEALKLYNTLMLKLQKQQPPSSPLTKHHVGLQLWRELVDGLASKALWLRHTLGLPDNDKWGATQKNQDGWDKLQNEEKMDREKTALIKEEKKGGNTKEEENEKETNKDNPAEEHGFSYQSSSTGPLLQQLQLRYRHLLHQQVYAMMESMIDSLCDLFDEVQQEDN